MSEYCPYCEAPTSNLIWGRLEVDGINTIQKVSCGKCGGEWINDDETDKRIRNLETDRDKAWVLLTWAEALIRSLSGWPETHPNEVTEWKEEWRLLRMRREQRNTMDETEGAR